MRKITLTLIGLLFLNVNLIVGQEFKKIDYQFGFGTTVSIPYKKTVELWPEFEGHPKTDYNSSLGYFFELIISYKINAKFAINSGLNYNYGRLKINDKIGLTESKGNITNSYLNVPILIRFQLSDNIPISFSSGAYMGILIGAKEKGTSYIDTAGFVDSGDPVLESIEPVQDYNNDIKGNYKKYDFGLSTQLDFEVKLNNKFSGIIFSRFNYGLTDVITNETYTNSSASEWKNMNLMFGIGLRL